MMKRFFSIIFVFIPLLLSAQYTARMDSLETVHIPPEAQYSETFKISPIYFNKRVDPAGLGEILEIEMVFQNLIDEPIAINVITVATVEYELKSDSSFQLPINKWDIIKYLDASPDADNFKYVVKDESGNPKKDYYDRDMHEYKKIPNDPKKGNFIVVDDTYLLRTYHVSKFRKKYEFFNTVTVLVYNKAGEPIFSCDYTINHKRK
ncbi:MAG: hypothetical protein FWG13_06205 [Leptospirales bacterium]|nr:hypothetical protein [Leptospirales bacterium]